MGLTEIILIVVGAFILILGYFFPKTEQNDNGENPVITEKKIKDMIEKETNEIKNKINAIVDDIIEDAVENTERSMERLSNEKIMSVNEYSDTVLAAIDKNHDSVMFLYDMLNEKHESLVKMVAQANICVKEIQELQGPQEMEVVAPTLGEFEQIPAKVISPPSFAGEQSHSELEISEKSELLQNGEVCQSVQEKKEDTSLVSDGIENSNGKILAMHKAGKNKTLIAKELGLGVGEVKLVIDLFESL